MRHHSMRVVALNEVLGEKGVRRGLPKLNSMNFITFCYDFDMFYLIDGFFKFTGFPQNENIRHLLHYLSH